MSNDNATNLNLNEAAADISDAELDALDQKRREEEREKARFAIYGADNNFLYRSNQEEYDDIVFNVCAFGTHSMTIPAHDGKIQFTFVTINEVEERAINKAIGEYVKKESPTNKEIQRFEKLMYIANQLQSVSINGTMINYAEKPTKERIALLEKMATQQIDFYGMYLWCFQEVIRKALVNENALGNF